MKSVFIEKPYSVSFKEQKTPKIGPKEIYIKTAYCGICGTDVHIYKGQIPFVKYPIIPGHEISGTITEIGNDVSGMVIGDRVAINPNISCKDLKLETRDYCFYCKRNRPHFCKNWEAIGVTRPGGFAEFVKCPGSSAIKIPSSRISLKEAAFMEPIACTLHGLKKLAITSSDIVLIIGAGPIGLLMISLIKNLYSPKIIVCEPLESRRVLASTFGASLVIDSDKTSLERIINDETSNEGVDVSIEAVGNVGTAMTALKLLNKGGRSLIFGVASPEDKILLNLFDLYSKEWSIFGSFTNPHENQEAMEILNKKIIDLEILVSHELSLASLEKGFQLMLNKGGKLVNKILVKLE
ncbi:MAG: zinc-dependent alcohol dehydrogenase family protein [Candidatus Heimdallarchaeota archaeon]|nr:zinc-dependent alcohol dehydrogenase family protein [Candidatus Heimdallarchaeota archaeon]